MTHPLPSLVDPTPGRRIWRGEGWTLYQGDALRVLPTLPDASVDLVVTDCPYSSGGAYRGDRTQSTRSKYVNSDSANQALPEFAGDTRDQRAFAYWSTLWYSELLRIAKPGALCCTFTDWRQLPSTTDAFQAGGWIWRGVAPWNKTEATRPQSGRLRAQCEYIVWGTGGPHQPYDGAPSLPGFYEIGVERDRYHIAQKPLPLMADLVRLAPPHGVVLDPFAGSGTTGEACLQEGRVAQLIELVPETCDLIVERLRAFEAGSRLTESRKGQGALFGNGEGQAAGPGETP